VLLYAQRVNGWRKNGAAPRTWLDSKARDAMLPSVPHASRRGCGPVSALPMDGSCEWNDAFYSLFETTRYPSVARAA